MNHRSILAGAFALAMLCLPLAHAQGAGGDIEFRNTAEVEVEVKTADGKVEKKKVTAQKVLPGAEVTYTSTYRNIGKRAAGNIAIVNPVPANTTLVGGSAYGDNTDITFSADGGKTWAPVSQVKVVGADGKERPAGISEFTHIRWTHKGELAPGKQGVVGFRVVVN
jgi:uncharacterized repeat protein (TIGR01451 family)